MFEMDIIRDIKDIVTKFSSGNAKKAVIVGTTVVAGAAAVGAAKTADAASVQNQLNPAGKDGDKNTLQVPYDPAPTPSKFRVSTDERPRMEQKDEKVENERASFDQAYADPNSLVNSVSNPKDELVLKKITKKDAPANPEVNSEKSVWAVPSFNLKNTDPEWIRFARAYHIKDQKDIGPVFDIWDNDAGELKAVNVTVEGSPLDLEIKRQLKLLNEKIDDASVQEIFDMNDVVRGGTYLGIAFGVHQYDGLTKQVGVTFKAADKSTGKTIALFGFGEDGSLHKIKKSDVEDPYLGWVSPDFAGKLNNIGLGIKPETYMMGAQKKGTNIVSKVVGDNGLEYMIVLNQDVEKEQSKLNSSQTEQKNVVIVPTPSSIRFILNQTGNEGSNNVDMVLPGMNVTIDITKISDQETIDYINKAGIIKVEIGKYSKSAYPIQLTTPQGINEYNVTFTDEGIDIVVAPDSNLSKHPDVLKIIITKLIIASAKQRVDKNLSSGSLVDDQLLKDNNADQDWTSSNEKLNKDGKYPVIVDITT